MEFSVSLKSKNFEVICQSTKCLCVIRIHLKTVHVMFAASEVLLKCHALTL